MKIVQWNQKLGYASKFFYPGIWNIFYSFTFFFIVIC